MDSIFLIFRNSKTKNSVLYLEKALKMKTDLVKSNGKNNTDAYLTDIDIESELSNAKKKL